MADLMPDPLAEEPDPLLGEVETFLARTGMTASVFGRAAMGDPSFVFDLRAGRELRRATRARAAAQIGRYLVHGDFAAPSKGGGDDPADRRIAAP